MSLIGSLTSVTFDVGEIAKQVTASVVESIQPMISAVSAMLLRPWDKISQSTQSSKQSNDERTEQVLEFYGIQRERCMVLGATRAPVITSHIWPKHTCGQGLTIFGLVREDVNNERNLLRLHHRIEHHFDRRNLIFQIVDSHPTRLRLKLVVLNSEINNQQLDYHDLTFAQLNGREFDFPVDQAPFRRLLAVHAFDAFLKARDEGWVTEEFFNSGMDFGLQLASRSVDEEFAFRIQLMKKNEYLL